MPLIKKNTHIINDKWVGTWKETFVFCYMLQNYYGNSLWIYSVWISDALHWGKSITTA